MWDGVFSFWKVSAAKVQEWEFAEEDIISNKISIGKRKIIKNIKKIKFVIYFSITV